MSALLHEVATLRPCIATGRVTSVRNDLIVSSGPPAKIGELCEIGKAGCDSAPLMAEIVGLSETSVRLVPLGEVGSVGIGDTVTVKDLAQRRPSVDDVAGRAMNALAQAIDGGSSILADKRPLPEFGETKTVNPSRQFQTGIRAIDGLLPLAQGQRIGIFAPSGAGKTTLVEKLFRFGECDRIILCQIGERGREIEKAWQTLNSTAGLAPFTLVAAKASESASLRVRALDLAIALAEQARLKGEHVLLVVDSVTRVAMALRELGIAAGEPPAARGYTSNVFARLPREIERCGAVETGGAISGVFTVLSETDDVDDPLVEMMKSILDGHIILSRSLAERRHFPAIDIARSVSRLAQEVYCDGQGQLSSRVHRTNAIYADAEMMIESGLYKKGTNGNIDKAIAAKSQLDEFLKQSLDERSNRDDTLAALQSLAGRCCDA